MPDAAMLAHTVYFALRDNSRAGIKAFVGACKEYLTGHPGMVLFALTLRAHDVDSPVNDRQFDVAIHLVFSDKASHDQYQDSPRHVEFLEKWENSWTDVRAFDSYVDAVVAAASGTA